MPSIRFLAIAALAAVPFVAQGATRPKPGKPAMPFDGSMICSIQVKDLKAAQRWYADVLGCELRYELPSQGWCEMSTPNPAVMLGLHQVAPQQDNGGAKIGLGVTEMAGAVARLREKQVRLDGDVVVIPQTVKLLTFFDPDGNRLFLYEPFQGK